MKREVEISVVVGTYNRSKLLAAALDSLLEQSGGPPHEIIIVDNNSNDSTRKLVHSRIAEAPSNLRYLFEPKQGTSHARNTGILNARGSIIAFTDDDVRVARDWVANLKQEFDAHPEAEFLGGKILPRWKTSPPDWLTRDHWWPLALLDCGDQPFYVDANNPLCLPTANASFRASVFKQFGLFSPEFSGREDHEFLVRLWRGGCRGLYAPTVVAHAEVQDERLKKSYHRAWNIKTGQFNSLMRLNEIMGADGRIAGDCPEMVTLFGVPAFCYRNFLAGGAGWIAASLLGRRASALRSKNCFWYFAGYISKRYQQNAIEREHSGLIETARFLKNFCNKKLRWKRSAAGQVSEITRRETI